MKRAAPERSPIEPRVFRPVLSASLPRRGLSCEEAAGYVGISVTKFLEMVGEGRMPKSVRIDRRAIWDIRELDAAFDALREPEQPAEPVDDGWGDAAP